MSEIKHAYLIIVHENSQVFECCCKLIDHPRNNIYLLIDSKSSEFDVERIKSVLKYSKLTIIPSIKLFWAGVSLIEGELALISAALEDAISYQYYHFLTGADLPIKSQKEIHEFFDKYNGEEFIEFNSSKMKLAKYKTQVYHFFVENNYFRYYYLMKVINHGLAKIQEKLGVMRQKNKHYYHGSAMFSITEAFASYLIVNKKRILKEYKYSLACDEVFMQTEIINSPFKSKVHEYNKLMYSNARFIEWNNKKNHNSPTVFTINDFDRLIKVDNGLLFARKFCENEDYEIVVKLYNYISENEKKS